MDNVGVVLVAIHSRGFRSQLIAYGFTHSGVVCIDFFAIFHDDLIQAHALALDFDSGRIDQLDEVLGVGFIFFFAQ